MSAWGLPQPQATALTCRTRGYPIVPPLQARTRRGHQRDVGVRSSMADTQNTAAAMGHIRSACGHAVAQRLAASQPAALTNPSFIPLWDFLIGLGLHPESVARLLHVSASDILAATTRGSFQPYSAGAALLWLRGEPLRLSQDEVVNRVLLNCPQLLAVEVEQLDAMYEALASSGVFEAERLPGLVRQCPGILVPQIHDEVMTVLALIRRSRVDKFVNSGSYHV
ncbi:hypothetical protein V8C86DRAFT_2738656 [Haematococcus lacustris]